MGESDEPEKLWSRVSVGRPRIFDTPEDLWAAAVAYFDWVEASPLQEEKVFSAMDGIRHAQVAKMQAMTLGGLCLHMNISRRTWGSYREREEFLPICEQVEEVIATQKLTGAAAGLLNPSIIAREMGLADKREVSGGLTIEGAQVTFVGDEEKSDD